MAAINQNDPNMIDPEEINPRDQIIETDLPLFFGNETSPEQNQFIDNVLALPRGFGKAAARSVIAEIPEGLWALADLATDLTGFEDALDEKESVFLDRLQDARDKIGYEESVPGKLGEALGSMATFAGTMFLTGGAAALTGVPRIAQAARLFQSGKLIKAAKMSPEVFAFASAPGIAFSASEENLSMKAARKAGKDYTRGERNLALALSIPIGITEFIPIGRIFGGMKRADVPPEKFWEYTEILKRGFRGAGEEGLQEAGAGVLHDLVEKGIYNPDAVIGETWASEFGYGAGAGGIFSLLANIYGRKTRNYNAAVENGDPDPEAELIRGLQGTETDEVAKQHGLDVPTEHESEIDAFNAGQEIPIRPDISTPETTVPLPEIDTADAVIRAKDFEAEKLAEVAEGTTTLEDADQATRAEAERQLSLDFEETQIEEDTPIEVEETTEAEEIITPEAVADEDVVEVEPKPKVKAKSKRRKFINYREQLKDNPFAVLEGETVLPLIEEGFHGETKVALIAAGYPDFARSGADVNDITNSITPLEARKILQHYSERTTDADNFLGGTEGVMDWVFESELIEVAQGKEAKPLNSFWVATDTSIDDSINDGKVSAQEMVDRILATNPKPMSVKEINERKEFIESKNKQGTFFTVEADGTLTSIADNSQFLIDEETALSIYPQKPADVIPIKRAKGKPKPAKRIPLIKTYKNKFNKGTVEVGFPDEESVRVYGDLQKQTKRVKGQKVKSPNESAAFRKNVKNKLGITTAAYKRLNSQYRKYIKDNSDDSIKAKQEVFTPISFADFVNDKIGPASPEAIVTNLQEKNISTSDSAFKKFLKVNAGVDSLDRVTGIKRREIMRQISTLPTMDRKNSSIDRAFNIERDNIRIATKDQAVTDYAKKLYNKNNLQSMISLAQSNGVPSQSIFSKSTSQPLNKMDIARAISLKRINDITTAEEFAERIAAVAVPNAQVRKITPRKADTVNNMQPYKVTFLDKSEIRVLLPNVLEGQQARDQAALLALEERAFNLKEENEKNKTVPDASERDYIEAVRYMLTSGYNPLGILQELVGAKSSMTLAWGDTVTVPTPSDLQQTNIRHERYRFKENVDAQDLALNLRRITKRMFPTANVAVVDNLFSVEGKEVAGTTIGDMIAISLDKKFAKPEDTIYHEAVHWFVNNGFFDNDVLDTLRDNEGRIRNIAEARLGSKPETFEEAVAIASGVYGEAKLNGQTPFEFLPPMRKFFDKIYKFFNRIKTFLNNKKYNSIDDIFDAMETGQLYKEGLENQVQLTPVNETFAKQAFRDGYGNVGSYTGGNLVQRLDSDYARLNSMNPFWINTQSFAVEYGLTGMSLNSHMNDALKDAIDNTKTKETKASNWLNVLPKNIKKKYFEETGLDDWLKRQGDQPVTKKQIQDYVDANTGIYSVHINGPNAQLIPLTANEREAVSKLETQATLIANRLQQTEDQLRIIATKDGRFYQALQKNYNGPTSGYQSAFYSAVQTDQLIDIWEKWAKTNKNIANKIFPLDERHPDFDHLRKAFNPEVADPAFLYSRADKERTDQIISDMLTPFVTSERKPYGPRGRLMRERLDPYMFTFEGPNKSIDPDGKMEKFWVDIMGGAKDIYVDESGKIKISGAAMQADPLMEYLDGVEDIDSFVKNNGFSGEDNTLYNIEELLKARKALSSFMVYYQDMMNGESPGRIGGETKWAEFMKMQGPIWDKHNLLIKRVDPSFSHIDRMQAHQRALAEGFGDDQTRIGNAERSAAIGNFFQKPSGLVVPVGQIPRFTQPYIEQDMNEEIGIAYGDAVDTYNFRWNNTRYENYREHLFSYAPPVATGNPYMNDKHFVGLPGQFFHIRTADVFDAEEKRYLLLEELQSDFFDDLQNAFRSLEMFNPYDGGYLGLNPSEQAEVNNNIKNATEEDMDKAYSEIKRSLLKDVDRIPLIGKYNPDFNAWQDFAARYLTKFAIDNNYDGIKIISPELQSERVATILSDNFDGLYYSASVNPHDVEPFIGFGDGESGFIHTPSNQFIPNEELRARPDLFTAADALPEDILNDINAMKTNQLQDPEIGPEFQWMEDVIRRQEEQELYQKFPNDEDYMELERQLTQLREKQARRDEKNVERNRNTLKEKGFYGSRRNFYEKNITSGRMAAANLFAEKFSENIDSSEFKEYVNYARLTGMAGQNVARDVAVPFDFDKNSPVMHHEATQGLSTAIPSTTTQNFIQTADFYNKKDPNSEKYSMFATGSVSVSSLLPKNIAEIITKQIRLGVKPDFSRSDVAVIDPSFVEADTGLYDPFVIKYQQDQLSGVGNGYFNFRSMSPRLMAGFTKEGSNLYGRPMTRRFIDALKKVGGKDSYERVGPKVNQVIANLYGEGVSVANIDNNDWWANRLFAEAYKGMEGRFPEVIEEEINQGLSRREFLKTVFAGTAIVNVPSSLVPVDKIRKHIERIGGLDTLIAENHPIDYIEDLKSLLSNDSDIEDRGLGLEMLQDLYETTDTPFTQEELMQEYGESEKFVNTYRKYRGAMEPYLDIALQHKADKRAKQEQERIREETEDVVYDELNDVEQDEVLRAKYEGQQKVESRLGQNVIGKNGKENPRFRLRGFKFKEGLTEKYGRSQGTPMAKYSSTPADAQRASIWRRLLDKGQNLTQSKMFSGVGGLPQLKKYLIERYKAFGRIGIGEQAAKTLYHDIGSIVNPTKGKDTEEKQTLRRELTDFMEGGWDADPEMISNPKLRKLAIKSKNMIDRVGRMLVNKGLLPKEKYEENRGQYLPMIYMKHVLNHPTGQPLSYLKERKDLDDETRLILGDISDLSPEFRIFAGITRPLRDLAMLDFFETVSNEQEWAIKDNDVMVTMELDDGKTMNVSAFWLRQEADRLNEQATYFEGREPEASANMRMKAQEYEVLARPALGNEKEVEGYRRIPKTRKYGMLQGVAVRKEIYNDIIGSFTLGDTDNFYNKAVAAMKKGTSIWKTLKVPLNPPTVVRNVGSNMILMNLVGGIPIHKVMPRMKQAIDQINSNGPAWQVAQKFGIKSTGFSEQEMYQVSDEMLDLMQQQHQLGDITKFFAMPKILAQRLLKKGGDLYQFTESVGKTAIIIDAMDRGMNEADAFLLAQKSLFDYSDVPPGGKLFRSAPIGMPFFTFYYKAFPALVEVALNNPMRFLPYIALSAGLTALSGFAFGFEDDDAKKLQKSLEPWLARRTGVHVLPWKDSDGRFQFLDIGYFFPWTMYGDALKNVASGEFMELQRTTGFLSGPFSDILLALKTNRDPFTQRVIWDKRDPVEERIENLMWYTYSLGMPSWLTPNGAISKTVKAFQDKPRPTGQPSDTVPQALLRFVGINMYGLEPKETRQRNIKRMRQDIDDTRQRMRWTMRNKSLDQDTKDARRIRYLALIKQKQEVMSQYMIDTALPSSLLRRKSRLQ